MKFVTSIFFLFLLINSNFCKSQHNKNVIIHIIKAGETVSSLSKQYKIDKASIFNTNNLNENSVINIGQKVLIPMSKVKSPPPHSPNAELLKNQHQISAGETLSKIAKQYQISEQEIRDWNDLQNDLIKLGDKIFIKKPYNYKREVIKKDPQKIVTPIIDTKKEIEKKIEPEKVTEIKEKNEEKVIETAIIENLKPEVKINNKKIVNGFFESQFQKTKSAAEGISGTFKTLAGWQDKKYYVLFNEAENGSIVKISANNKLIYAKVLGPLPNIKDDSNLLLRISTSAAHALNIDENKFTVRIEY